MIRILIADDHAIMREGLKKIFADIGDMDVVGEASTGLEVLQKIRGIDCDVLLLDIAMPGQGGVNVLKQVKGEKPGIFVLMLSMYPEAQYAVRSLKAGASGYLTKESPPEELVRAIRMAFQGRKYVSASLAEKLAVDLDVDPGKPPHEALSDREYQVLCMIASGKAVSEIGEELSLSVKTISTYRTRILEKMGMKTSAQLVHYAVKNRLVE